MLPPEFTCSADQVAEYVNRYFPVIPQCVKNIANYALASLVYHSQVLIDCLPENHPIFNTQLFIDVSELQRMRENVRCHVPEIDV